MFYEVIFKQYVTVNALNNINLNYVPISSYL